MKVHVQIDQQGIKINEAFTGGSAEQVVGEMKKRVAKELNFAMRLVVNGMSNLMFAQEVVKQYNTSQKLSLPIPNSCEAFLTLAQEQGFAKIEAA